MQASQNIEWSTAHLAPGVQVAGRYRVRRFIANGATFEVYEARDEHDGTRVALKVVHPAPDDTSPALEAFDLEAAAYARVDSPHVPKLYRIGTLPDRSRFMVLELLRGTSLSERLARGPLSLSAVLELGCQLLSALHAVHSAGLVHCDVKPQNLLVGGEPPDVHAWLVDFGISVVVRAGHADAEPPTGTVVGTPEYMSPEQARGEVVDLRTDLYSAGVVLYQALTGRLPFAGDSDRELLLAKLRDPVVPPRVLRASCPVELERVLMRTLARNRDYRFSAAHRVLDNLRWIRDRHAPTNGWATTASLYPQPRSTPQAVTRPASSVGRNE